MTGIHSTLHPSLNADCTLQNGRPLCSEESRLVIIRTLYICIVGGERAWQAVQTLETMGRSIKRIIAQIFIAVESASS